VNQCALFCCRLVILAGDTNPIDVISHMPVVCEDKSIPYCYTPSKEVCIITNVYILVLLEVLGEESRNSHEYVN